MRSGEAGAGHHGMKESSERSSKRQKLSPLPKNYKVEKRPLLRPAIPSPFAGASTQKVVYVSTKMPFMAAVKRVQKLLNLVEKRETQSTVEKMRNQGPKKRKGGIGTGEDLDRVAAAMAEKRLAGGREVKEEVVMKGTGKAIEKTLGLALWFQQRDEYRISIKTGSVGAIDDIVPKDEDELDGNGKDEAEDGKEDEPVPESRIRYTSVVEVSVALQ